MDCYDDNRRLGARLRQLRKACGLTQAEVALLMGKRKRTIGDWENGILCRSPRTFHELLDLYGIGSDCPERNELTLIAYGKR